MKNENTRVYKKVLGKIKIRKDIEVKPDSNNKMKTTEVIAMLLNDMTLENDMKIKVTATTQINYIGSCFELGKKNLNCTEQIELPAIEIIIEDSRKSTQTEKTIDNSFCIAINIDYTSVYKNHILSKGIPEKDLEVIMGVIADCTQNQSCYIEKSNITKIFQPVSPDYAALKYSRFLNV